MTVTGIIAEFNPFHNGHKYLLEQARGLGVNHVQNFVQHGEACHCRQMDSARRWLWKMGRTWWSSSPFSRGCSVGWSFCQERR